jgi:hypothetical protein
MLCEWEPRPEMPRMSLNDRQNPRNEMELGAYFGQIRETLVQEKYQL